VADCRLTVSTLKISLVRADSNTKLPCYRVKNFGKGDRHGGVPLTEVKSIKLHRINSNRNGDRLDTVDQAMNLPLQTESPAAPCAPFMYHREHSTVGNPIQLLPGSYQVTVQARIDGHNRKKTVGFDVSSCDFNPTVVVDF